MVKEGSAGKIWNIDELIDENGFESENAERKNIFYLEKRNSFCG